MNWLFAKAKTTVNPTRLVDIGRFCFAVCLWCGLAFSANSEPAEADDKIIEYANGQWFDGNSFKSGTFYAQNGILSAVHPVRIDQVIDLDSGYVIPPLAESHAHALDNLDTLATQVREFLEIGVFYVMVQGTFYNVNPDIKTHLKRTGSLEVVYTQCPLIQRNSSDLASSYVAMMEQGAYPGRTTLDEIDGHVVCLIDSEQDLNSKWDDVTSLNSQFIKVVLGFSDEYEERRALSLKEGTTSNLGIDPALMAPIVERAHAAGLRVSTHIETAADFRVATEAGVDMIAHLPGWRIGESAGYSEISLERWKLTKEDARVAAANGVTVMTTSLPKKYLRDYSENIDNFRTIHSHNLEVLSEQGVSIAIGSDNPVLLTTAEILHISDLGVFDNLTLLNMAVDTTAKTIFPERQIGKLREGYEANFIVLQNNPLANLNNLKKIRLRIKAGKPLKFP